MGQSSRYRTRTEVIVDAKPQKLENASEESILREAKGKTLPVVVTRDVIIGESS